MAELSRDAELNFLEKKVFLACQLQAGSFGFYCKEVRGQKLTRMGVQGKSCFALHATTQSWMSHEKD